MKKQMILLFSHQLSDPQKADATNTWGVEEFVYLPQKLQQIWSNISPDLDSLKEVLEPIKSYVKEVANENDLILIQGDFGASYMMVNYAKSLNLAPVYATTKRMVQELVENGKTIKKSIFEHRRFREYE